MNLREEIYRINHEANHWTDEDWTAKYGDKTFQDVYVELFKKWALEMVGDNVFAENEWEDGQNEAIERIRERIEEVN